MTYFLKSIFYFLRLNTDYYLSESSALIGVDAFSPLSLLLFFFFFFSSSFFRFFSFFFFIFSPSSFSKQDCIVTDLTKVCDDLSI